MGESFLDKNGGCFDVNGLIKDYYVYAGDNISAGSFVEFVNGVASTTTETSSDTQLSTKSDSGYMISAVVLPNGNVFVAHSVTETNSWVLYGMIVTISETIIAYGTDTRLVNYNLSGAMISTVVLPNGNVFIAHNRGTSFNTYGIVCTISGTTISVGTDTSLDTINGEASKSISATLLPNGNVFVAHSYNTANYLRGMVCTIDEKTITKGTDYALNGATLSSVTKISTSLLPNGNVFIAHDGSSSHYLYGIVCTISGTTITSGSDTQLSTKEKLYRSIKSLTLKNGNVFIAHCDDNDNFSLYGIVCTISGTSITAGVDTQLSNLYKSGIIFDANIMEDENIFIAHIVDSNPVNSLICSISGKTIICGNQYILENNLVDVQNKIESLLLSNGTICLFHDIHNDSNDNTLNAQVFGITDNIPSNNVVIPTYETQVRNVTSSYANGIAKTSGIGGDSTGHNQQVKVYVPDV